MAAVGKNVRVDAYKIFSRIVDKHKHVHCFTEAHPEISYATLCQLFAGKTTAMRAETVVKLAGALECPVSELVIPNSVPEKKETSNKNTEGLRQLIAEMGL